MGSSDNAVWKVVGGTGKGGILVREGVALDSKEVEERLATGSLVKQLTLQGERLHFQRLDGAGPESGWVSTKMKGKELLMRVEAKLPTASVATESQRVVAVDPPANKKIRILALHGGGANINIMKFQTMQLQSLLKGKAEWEFLNGGRDWEGDKDKDDEMMKAISKGMPLFGWYKPTADGPSSMTMREKMFDPSFTFTYEFVDQAVDRVMDHIKTNGPFDVVLGFSQGCIVTHLVSGTLRSRGEEIPWKISILFNGLKVRDDRYMELFEEKLRQPAVMIFGRQDDMYEYGQKQKDLYENPVVLEHDEGHKFPSLKPRSTEVYDEVVKLVLQHCIV